MFLWSLVSSQHCLLTEIRNHPPQGPHGPPSIWQERWCRSQLETLRTISFNYRRSDCEEVVRRCRGTGWCLKLMRTSVSVSMFYWYIPLFLMMHSRTALCATVRRAEPSLLRLHRIKLHRPDPDETTTQSHLSNRTNFTWFSSIISDVIKKELQGGDGSCWNDAFTARFYRLELLRADHFLNIFNTFKQIKIQTLNTQKNLCCSNVLKSSSRWILNISTFSIFGPNIYYFCERNVFLCLLPYLISK